jgi:hypothetical protein
MTDGAGSVPRRDFNERWRGEPPDGARTPEELETLLEDACITRDHASLMALFEAGGVLVVGEEPSACGSEAIARLALAAWAIGHLYLADPRRIVQTRDLALVVGEQAINVMRRGSDDVWRFAISLQLFGGITARTNGQ